MLNPTSQGRDLGTRFGDGWETRIFDWFWKGTILRFSGGFSVRLGVFALFVLFFTGGAAVAGTIRGTVTNGTNGKPSAGDKVTLLSLSAGLEELSSTTTDRSGQFSLTTPQDTVPYLVKVEHQKGAYFKNMPPGVTTAEIKVYDVAAKVEGVTTEADVLRFESDPSGQLKVTENYFVKNTSSPPRTQSSEHTFEVVLPQDAVLEGAATVGPSNMPLAATPDPVNPKGHYAFSFPIRPNEGDSGTRFQLTYHVPYSGSLKFNVKEMQGSDNLAIILPKTMQFASSGTPEFKTVPEDIGAQTFLARGIKVGETVTFTLSGQGALPRDTQAAPPGGGGPAGGPGAGAGPNAGGSVGDQSGDAPVGRPGGTPGGGLGNPIDTPDPLSKYKYWILAGLAVVLAGAAAFLLRKPGGAVPAAASIEGAVGAPIVTGRSKKDLLLEALKEELFAIESEKVAGTLTEAQYAEYKGALDTVLRRTLARKAV